MQEITGFPFGGGWGLLVSAPYNTQGKDYRWIEKLNMSNKTKSVLKEIKEDIL